MAKLVKRPLIRSDSDDSDFDQVDARTSLFVHKLSAS